MPLTRTKHLSTAGGKMMTVGDDPGRQLVAGQLLPDVVGMAGELGVGAVAEVRTHGCPGGDGGVNVLGGRGVVAERDL